MQDITVNSNKPERLISKDFVLVMVASLGTSFTNFIFFTAMPLYTLKVTGSDFFSGLMMTVYSIAALAARPVAGIVSDRYGRVRLLVAGAAICAAACALYGFTTAIVMLLFIRVVNGIGFGTSSTCAGAAAADIIPKSRMAEGIGYYSLYSTVSTALGPYIALAVVGKGEMEDFRTLFFFTAGLCLMSTICSSCITYERRRRQASSENPGGEQAAAEEAASQPSELPKTFLGFEYAVFLPMAVLILLFFGQTSINTFLALIAAQRGFGNIGLFYTISAACLFASRFLYAKLMDRRGPEVLVVPGILCLTACILAIPFVGSELLLYIIAVPLGFANGAVYPSINAMLFLRCSPQRRGTASAAYFASIDIGFALGGVVFGLIAGSLGYNVVYFVASGLTAAALLLFLKAIVVKKR